MLKITEELLRDMGFIKGVHVWEHSFADHNFKLYHDGNNWQFTYNEERCTIVVDLLGLIRVVATIAYNSGKKETQNKLQDALGLDRLLQSTVEETIEHLNRNRYD